MIANSYKPIFISNAEIMIHFKNESSNKGGHPLPGSLLTLIHAKLLVQEPWPVQHVGITERNRTMPFAFPHACSTKTWRGFYQTYQKMLLRNFRHELHKRGPSLGFDNVIIRMQAGTITRAVKPHLPSTGSSVPYVQAKSHVGLEIHLLQLLMLPLSFLVLS